MFGIVEKYFLIPWLNVPHESAHVCTVPGGAGRVGCRVQPRVLSGRRVFVWVQLGHSCWLALSALK